MPKWDLTAQLSGCDSAKSKLCPAQTSLCHRPDLHSIVKLTGTRRYEEGKKMLQRGMRQLEIISSHESCQLFLAKLYTGCRGILQRHVKGVRISANGQPRR